MSKSANKPTAGDVLLPHSIESEMALLGAILVDPIVINSLKDLAKVDFFQVHCGLIFESLQELNREGSSIDLVTLGDKLETKGLLDSVGGAEFIVNLINACPTALHAPEYAKKIKQYSIRRQVINSAGKIAQAAYDKQADDDLDGMLSKVQAELQAINMARREQGLRHIKDIAQDYYDDLDARQNKPKQAMDTGLADVDAVLGGMQPGDFVVVGGRPGMGKTAFALTVLLNVAKTGKSVALFSLEMTAPQVLERLISHECGVPVSRLRKAELKDEEWPLFLNTVADLAQLNIYISEQSASTVNYIRSESVNIQQTAGLDLVVVDYLQLMECHGVKDRQEQIAIISRTMKALAKELNVRMMALSQLNRAVESRTNKRPALSDLRESGNIEQDADVVLFLYRDEVYNEDTSKPNVCEVIAAKHRHGSIGVAEIGWNGKTTSFYNLVKTNVEDVEF